MLYKTRMGYRFGFEVALWNLATIGKLLSWTFSYDWWTQPGDPGAKSAFQAHLWRFVFTIGTHFGFAIGKLVLLASPPVTFVAIAAHEMDEPTVRKPQTIH